jgi:hypothetical protein
MINTLCHMITAMKKGDQTRDPFTSDLGLLRFQAKKNLHLICVSPVAISDNQVTSDPQLIQRSPNDLHLIPIFF